MPSDTSSIAYVIGTYPLLTTTFIDREIEQLRRSGTLVTIVGLRPPTGRPLSPDQHLMIEDVVYVRPATLRDVLVAHVRFFVARPLVLLAAYGGMPLRPHPRLVDRIKTIAHVGLGVLVADALRRDGVRHIHAHFVDRAATVAWVASRLLGIRYSVTAHANDIYVSPVMLADKIRNAKFAATCTGYNRDYLLSQISPDLNVVAIHHGISVRDLPESSDRESPPIVLAVGQLREKKGFGYLLEAVARITDRAFRLVVVGEGPLRAELEQLAAKAEGLHPVLFTGALPHSEVIDWMQRASVFALPAVVGSDGDRDGIPNVILEAMAMGLPVVSTRHSGIPEAVIDGTTGILVEPTDSAGLANALAILLDDAELRGSMGVAGRRYVAENFDLANNVAVLKRMMDR